MPTIAPDVRGYTAIQKCCKVGQHQSFLGPSEVATPPALLPVPCMDSINIVSDSIEGGMTSLDCAQKRCATSRPCCDASRAWELRPRRTVTCRLRTLRSAPLVAILFNLLQKVEGHVRSGGGTALCYAVDACAGTHRVVIIAVSLGDLLAKMPADQLCELRLCL